MIADPQETGHKCEKIKIAVSGTADTGFLKQESLDLALAIGKEIAHQGAVIVSGATTGVPLWAAKGAKEAGAMSIGLSPAMNQKEHIEKYGLPIDFMDVIVYTGNGYPGRDILMIRTADAVIIGPGRIGTIHEFTVAFEDNKPIGILDSDLWETDEVIKFILEKSNRADDNKKIIYDKDPAKLVKRLIELVKTDKADMANKKF